MQFVVIANLLVARLMASGLIKRVGKLKEPCLTHGTGTYHHSCIAVRVIV